MCTGVCRGDPRTGVRGVKNPSSLRRLELLRNLGSSEMSGLRAALTSVVDACARLRRRGRGPDPCRSCGVFRSIVRGCIDGDGGADAIESGVAMASAQSPVETTCEDEVQLTEGRKSIVIRTQAEEEIQRHEPNAHGEERRDVHESRRDVWYPGPAIRPISILGPAVLLRFLGFGRKVEEPGEVVCHHEQT